jgi:predicted Ser/Thr protein kinase
MDYVYETSDDTQLLMDCAMSELDCRPGIECMEVGFGRGEILLKMASHCNTASASGSEINDAAITNIKTKIGELEEPIRSRICISSYPFMDGFSHKKFGLIVFNPPYLPSDDTDRYLDRNERNALIGGKKGIEATMEFLQKSSSHITGDGVIMIIASSLSNLSLLNAGIMKRGFRYDIVKSLSFDFEKLFCYRLMPKEALSYAISNNSSISYLAKGSRSYVYTYSTNHSIVLKEGINDMTPNFMKEFEILGLLQGIIRVPRPFNVLHNLIIMERINGVRADRHDDRIEIAAFLIEAAMSLDALMIFKREFSRPFSNVIVNDKGEVFLIDFERAVIGRRGNMNQLCEFLKREGLLDEHDSDAMRRENDAFSNSFHASLNSDDNYDGSLRSRAILFMKEWKKEREKCRETLLGLLKYK